VEGFENVSRMSGKSLNECSLRFLLRISTLTDDCQFILITTSEQVQKQKKERKKELTIKSLEADPGGRAV
jgi:hypothetical protein